MIAIAIGESIYLYSGETGKLEKTIENIFNDNIVAMEFESLGTKLFVAGDRQVRVFVNITGYKVAIDIAKEKLKNKKLSSGVQQRLESQIEEYEKIINQHESLL